MRSTEEVKIKEIGSTTRKAKKAHICRCGLPISPGEEYTREVYSIDGDVRVEKIGRHACRSYYYSTEEIDG